MRKVLMVAYQFPPMGGSGVQRSVKFAKFLPRYGWEPVILTREAGMVRVRDESLLSEIPEGTEIIRTSPWDLTALPGPLSKAGKFIAWKLLIPDGEIIWMKRALNTALNRLAKGDINAVYTTSYPYSDHLLGLNVRKHFKDLPWVADFRDEWTNNPYLLDKPHFGWRAAAERKMERLVLSSADSLIANTPVMKRNFVNSNPDFNLDNRMSVIPNGFDIGDFEGYSYELPQNRYFTVTYAGSLYERRKPDAFFEAAGNLIRSGHIQPDKIRLRFIGNMKQGRLNTLIAMNGLQEVVDLVPYMEHAKCLDNVRRSDVLLLLEGGKGSEAFYTGKVFEYIQARRPILALVPVNGAAAELIRETNTGMVCDWSDVKCIEKGLLELYGKWAGKTLTLTPNDEEIKKYDRSILTGELARILDNML